MNLVSPYAITGMTSITSPVFAIFDQAKELYYYWVISIASGARSYQLTVSYVFPANNFRDATIRSKKN